LLDGPRLEPTRPGDGQLPVAGSQTGREERYSQGIQRHAFGVGAVCQPRVEALGHPEAELSLKPRCTRGWGTRSPAASSASTAAATATSSSPDASWGVAPRPDSPSSSGHTATKTSSSTLQKIRRLTWPTAGATAGLGRAGGLGGPGRAGSPVRPLRRPDDLHVISVQLRVRGEEGNVLELVNLTKIKGLELIINGKCKPCIEEMQARARQTAHDPGNDFFRTLQILQHLRDDEVA